MTCPYDNWLPDQLAICMYMQAWLGDAASEATFIPDEPKCRVCDDCLPNYGVAPHECFYKIGKPIGQSRVLPESEWPPNFEPDPDAPGLGTYHCPACDPDPRWREPAQLNNPPPELNSRAV